MPLALEQAKRLCHTLRLREDAGGKDWCCFDAVTRGTGYGPVGSVIQFVFANGEHVPRWVVKSKRHEAFSGLLDNEAMMLRGLELCDALPKDGLASIPEVRCPVLVYSGEWEGTRVVVESYVGGKVLRPIGGRRWERQRPIFARMMQWLAGFQARSGSNRGEGHGVAERLELALNLFREKEDLDREEERAVCRLEEKVRHIAGEFAACVTHGDFAPGNVRVSRQGAAVVDWEFGSQRGVPVVDAALWAAAVTRDMSRVSTRDLLRSDGALREFGRWWEIVGRDLLRVYSGAANMCFETVEECLPLAFAEIAMVQWRWYGTHAETDLLGRGCFRYLARYNQ